MFRVMSRVMTLLAGLVNRFSKCRGSSPVVSGGVQTLTGWIRADQEVFKRNGTDRTTLTRPMNNALTREQPCLLLWYQVA